jgi:hypothetical protein
MIESNPAFFRVARLAQQLPADPRAGFARLVTLRKLGFRPVREAVCCRHLPNGIAVPRARH